MQLGAGDAPGQGRRAGLAGADLRPSAEPLHATTDRRGAGPALGPDPGRDLMPRAERFRHEEC
nr:hypothetical protein [Bordetella genomosp. 1]